MPANPKKKPSLTQIGRLLGIVAHLDHHGQATFEELADHFGVSSERIKRDVEMLWCTGVPGYHTNDLLDFDPFAYDEGIVKLTNAQGLYQLRLSPAEAVSLVAALAALCESEAAPAAASSALAAVQKSLAHVATVASANATGEHARGVHDALAQAIEAAQAVDVTYVDSRDRRTQRRIEPHRIVVMGAAWYVECFCHKADDYRTLRLDRMLDVVPSDAPQSHPARPGDLSPVPMYDAAIAVRAPGRFAFEDLPGVTVTPQEGHYVVNVGVASPEKIAARILSVGQHVHSIEPRELREIVAAHAKSIRSVHER